MVEARRMAPLWQYLRHAPALWGNGSTLADGWSYLKAMRAARVPYLTGHTIVRALGKEAVESAVVARSTIARSRCREREAVIRGRGLPRLRLPALE